MKFGVYSMYQILVEYMLQIRRIIKRAFYYIHISRIEICMFTCKLQNIETEEKWKIIKNFYSFTNQSLMDI